MKEWRNFFDWHNFITGFHAAHVYAYYNERTRIEYEAARQWNMERETQRDELVLALDALCAKRADAMARAAVAA